MRIQPPRNHDLAAACAEAVIRQHKTELPDLSAVVILVPDTTQDGRIRRCLLDAADTDALMPPQITTLKQLFRRRHQNEYLPEAASRLLLGAELRGNIHLYNNTNCWQLADRMIPLFNELEEREELDALKEREKLDPVPMRLEDEAELLARIHQAWKDANAKGGKPNEAACYRQALRDDTIVKNDESLFLCGGIDQLSPTELQWVERLEQENRLTVIAHSTEPDPETSRAKALTLAWHSTEETPLLQRAAVCKKEFPSSPLEPHLSVLNAETFEQQAVGIQLRIIEWLCQGVTDIAVVSQDRKLMRRLRALLERENLQVYYPAGWSMSTTVSATTLLLLTPNAQTGFTPQTLERLARSPHCRYTFDRPALDAASAEIQQLLSQSAQVIETMDEAVQYLNSRDISADTAKLIQYIHKALQPLQRLCRNRREMPFKHFFETLENTMDKLGMSRQFIADPAGQQIVQAMEEMKATAAIENTKGNWALWRSWLSHNLETKHFIADIPTYGIGFYNLNQTALLKPQALVLAGLDHRHTRPSTRQYMLSDNSRQQLGLTTRARQLELMTRQFQTLLEKADKVLLSHQQTADDCPLTPAPWLDELQNFHYAAYRSDLTEHSIADIRHAIASGTHEVDMPIPAATDCPAPAAPKNLWPRPFSAQTYTSIRQCPYQFFVRYCLRVQAPQTMSDYDSRARYGTKIHRCLKKLHTADNIKDIVWNQKNAETIKQTAHEIAGREFSGGTDRHYHAAWDRREAIAALEQYIDWMINWIAEQGFTHAQFTMETQHDKQLAEDFDLQGRLDCVIRTETGDGDGKTAIIDYKTGNLPQQPKDMQIPFYSVLLKDATEAGYLRIKYQPENKPEKRFLNDLEDARNQHTQILRKIKQQFDQGAPLAAAPQMNPCGYCNYSGVCRIPIWGSKQT